jgi:hypothetical protein
MHVEWPVLVAAERAPWVPGTDVYLTLLASAQHVGTLSAVCMSISPVPACPHDLGKQTISLSQDVEVLSSLR